MSAVQINRAGISAAQVTIAIPNTTREGREASRQVFGSFFAGMGPEATAYRNALGGVRMRLATYRKRQEYAATMRRFGSDAGADEVRIWRGEVRKAVAKARDARAVLAARYPARPSTVSDRKALAEDAAAEAATIHSQEADMAQTPRRIEKLSPEQEARIPEFREAWLRAGLSAERADRPRAEAGVKLAYEAAGLAPPRLIVWLDSPTAGAMGAALLSGTAKAGKSVRGQVGGQVWDQVWAQVGAQVRGQVWDQVRGQVWDQVWDQVRGQVGAQVRGQVWDQVWAQVWDQVRGQVWDQVWDQVRGQVGAQVWAQVGAQVRGQVGGQVRDQVRGQVWDQVWDQVRGQVGAQVWAQVGDQVGAQVRGQVGRAAYGQHDANWLGFYAFFAEACGLESAARLRGLSEVAQSAGWWWPFEGVVILTERPTVLRRDTEDRLHCENGPALLYPDGTGVWAWHGTRLPQHWVEERETLDPTEVLRAENVEQRAAGSALLGWPRMAAKLDRKIIDGDPESDLGALVELTMPGLSRPGRFLQARCPRNGIICEGVPYVSDIDGLPIETALAAQAWRIGDPLSDYVHPPART